MSNLCIDLDVQAYKVALSVADELVLHAGVPSAAALQLIKEVCHHLHQCFKCACYRIKSIQDFPGQPGVTLGFPLS